MTAATSMRPSMRTTRPNGLPQLRDLPIRFKRRDATIDLSAFVGKETDHKSHSPYEYVSGDGRWIIRAVHRTGHGSTNSGRTRWYVVHDERLFPLRSFGSSYTISLEGAIDGIHKLIAQGLCDGFEVLAKMRQDAEDKARAAELRAKNLVRARGLVHQIDMIERDCVVAAIAEHVDLDALARAIDSAIERFKRGS